MQLEEVDVQQFELLLVHTDNHSPGTVYGCQFDTHYELLDYYVEHATFIFEDRERAIDFVEKRYEKVKIEHQLDLFDSD